MRILIADDEPIARELLQRIIGARTKHEVVVVDNGKDALGLALGDEPFDVLLLDWIMPEVSGPEICRRVRAAAVKQPYVALVTAKNMRQEVLEGMRAGADDFISKPIVADLLLARLAVAERRPTLRGKGSALIREALLSARAQGDGELVIKDRERTARVFFHEGQVAWAQLSDDSAALLELLSAEASLTPDDAREVIAECRRTGARLTDTLVAYGLIDRAALRVSLLNWTRRQLEKVLSFAEPEALFLPKKRRYAEELLFELEELVPLELPFASHRPPSLLPPPGDRAQVLGESWQDSFTQVEPSGATQGVEAVLERCLAVDGAVGGAILDRRSGVCLAYRGTLLSSDIAWAHLHMLNAVCREERVEEVVVVTDTHYHFVRLLQPGGDLLVYLIVRSKDVLLAMARVTLQRACGNGAEAPEPEPELEVRQGSRPKRSKRRS